MSSVVAVIPCYDVAKFCQKVICDTLSFVSSIVVIDDGSRDATAHILKELAQEYPGKVYVVTFMRNRGKGFAILEGFRYAFAHLDCDILVTLDGDAQHDPSYIPILTQSIQEGFEMVIGGRQFTQMPLRSRFANRWISFFLHCVYPDTPVDSQSGMRAFSHDFATEILHCIRGGGYEMEFRCLLLSLSQKRRMKEVPISTLYFEHNQSSHFSPIVDSLKILVVFFLFLIKRQ